MTTWKERAKRSVEENSEGTAPTKPTKPSSVSSVSANPAIFFPKEAGQPPADPTPSPLNGMECSGCDHLEMRDEHQPGSRRRFWWRCQKGHELLEVRRFGARITVSPEGCADFTPWKAGTQ